MLKAHVRANTKSWLGVLLCWSLMQAAVGQAPANNEVNDLIARSKTLLSKDSVGEALRLADRAVASARGDRTLTARAELQLSKVFSELGNYDRALEHGLLAMSATDEQSDDLLHYDALNSVGLAHYRMGHINDARSAFDRVLRAQGPAGDPRLRAFALNNLGMLEHAEGNGDKALENYRGSLALKMAMADTAAIVRTFNNIGTVYASRDQGDSALLYYRRSLEWKRIVRDRPGIASTLGNIGEVFGRMGVLDSARTYLEEAHAIADTLQLPAVQVDILHNLAELYKAMGDDKRALELKEAYIATRSKLLNERYDRRVADLQVGYDLEQKNAAIAVLEKEAEVRTSRIRSLVATAVALLVSVLLLIVAVRSRNRRLRHERRAFDQQQEIDALRLGTAQQENTRLSGEVEHKSRELASMATHAFQKNQLLNTFMEKLDAEERKPHDPASLIRTLRRSIKESIDLDADWEQFKLHFEEVHPRFFQTLNQRTPGLSLTDIRHCAYIRLDLDTKEIARLLNIAPTSVQIARVRLKKKLELDRASELKEFIRSIGM